jgi:hypothetical protein
MSIIEDFQSVGARTALTGGTGGTLGSRGSGASTSSRSVMHTFHTLRHFNELRKSVHRAETDSHAQIFNVKPVTQERPIRKLHFSSTRQLRNFSSSVYQDIGEVKSFQKNLLYERARQRSNQLSDIQATLSPSSSGVFSRPGSPQLSPTSPMAQSSFSPTMPKIEPLTSAKAKLAKYSLSFDPLIPDNQKVINGFYGQRLTRESFEILIRQGLHIVLSSKETDALYGTMDCHQDGTFDGKEFTRKFFNLGNDARREVNLVMTKGQTGRTYVSGKTRSNLEKESYR